MPNYFNPQSFNPGTQFKPSGYLGGVVAGEDRNRYNNLTDIFQQGQGYALSKQGMELGEFAQGAPQRALEGQSKMATARANIQNAEPQALAKTMQMEGEANSARLKAKSEDDMYVQKLSEAMAKSRSAQSDSEWNETINNVRQAAALQAAASQDPSYSGEGPLPLSVTSKLTPGSKLTDTLMKAGPQAGKLLRIMAGLDPTQINQMALNTQKEQAAMDRQKYSSDSSRGSARDVANINAEWHRAQIKAQSEKAAELKKVELEIARLGKLDSECKLDQVGQKYLKFLLDREFRLKQAGAMVGPGVGAAIIGGETGQRMQGAITGPAALPSAQGGQQQGPRTFASEQEALASGYKGNVIINGRPARID